MGMSNEEIAALISSSDATNELPSEATVPATQEFVISQEEMDSLLTGFVADDDESGENLIEEIYDAILDSGKLSLMQWVKLRERLRQIEELIPHIDLIIRLKSKNEKKRANF